MYNVVEALVTDQGLREGLREGVRDALQGGFAHDSLHVLS
jgi:hypothetical protein